MKRVAQNGDILGMVGRGALGTEDRADGSSLEAGVHLRWQMTPEIGFPPEGFHIYRREENYRRYLKCGTIYAPDLGGAVWTPDNPDHSGDLVSIAPSGETRTVRSCGPKPIYVAQFVGEQTIRIRFERPVRYVRMVFGEGTVPRPEVEAYWASDAGDVLMGTARAVRRGGRAGLQLFADRMDHLVLRGEDIVLCSFCFVFVQDGYDEGWGEPINGNVPIVLPITHPDWYAPHPHTPDDQAEAEARLPDALSPEKTTLYADGFRDELRGIIYDLVGTESQHLYRVQETDEEGVTDLDWSGMNLLQMMAVDPNIARVLGLYWHDEPPSPDTYYDYRVVGHYGDTHYPGWHVHFDDLVPGERISTRLVKDGVGFVSANPFDVVRTDWDGTEHTALRIARSILFAPVSIQLPAGVESVTLRVQAEHAFSVKAYNGTDWLDTENRLAGDHSVHIDYGKPFNKLLVLPLGDLTLVELIVRKRAFGMEDVTYQVYHLRSNTSPTVKTTTLEPPTAEPASTGLDENGVLTPHQNRVGLRWERYGAGGDRLLGGAPLLYHVERASVDDAGAHLDPRVLNEEKPAIVSIGDENRPRPFFGDFGVADGRYAYRVRGIDLFGVLGGWSDPAEVDVRDRRPPPPPQSVQAAYLDPADPYLSDEDRALADVEGPGIKVSWEWPGMFRLQAPDVVPPDAEFRIYGLMGERNAVRGVVESVVDDGVNTTMTTDLEWPGAANDLVGEFVRVNQHFFAITGHTAGAACAITVANLAGPAVAPAPGPFSIAFGQDRPYWKDYARTESWERRLYAEPAAAIVELNAVVASVGALEADAVVVRPGATHTVTLDVPLSADPMLTPGVLFCEGRVYRALGHEAGSGARIHIVAVGNPVDSAATVVPAAGADCTYLPGRRYEVYLPGVELPIPPGQPQASAHVAVSSSDGKAHIADDPMWAQPGRGGLGGRAGNEGALSPAAKVVAVLRAAPATVSNVPTAADPIFAAPADYYGRARYTLTWDATPGVAGYAVYRCSGGLLFETDRLQRERQTGPYAGGNAFFDDPGVDAWLAGYDAGLTTAEMMAAPDTHRAAWRAWAAQFYAGRTDVEIQDIAGRAGNEAAFRRLNQEGVATPAYDDVLDGRGQGRFLYRVRTIDAAGTLSAWSAAFPPVHLFDITPPATPVVTEVRGGERSITLNWRANREKDLAGYRVWRSESPDDLTDIRRRAPLATISPQEDMVVTFVDSNLAGLTPYFYKIVAEDEAGNLSAPTPLLSASPLDTLSPEPPSWTSASWVIHGSEQAIQLTWTALEDNLTCMVQRRPLGGGVWLNVSTWLTATNPPRDFTYVDRGAESGQEYEYRILGEDSAGNRTSLFLIQAVRFEVAPNA